MSIWLSLYQSLDDVSVLDDTELLNSALAGAEEFPELAAARDHLARLKLRVRYA